MRKLKGEKNVSRRDDDRYLLILGIVFLMLGLFRMTLH